MIWGTSIWRLACLNRSKIPSAQKCYPCSRYKVSPMSPGWTPRGFVWLIHTQLSRHSYQIRKRFGLHFLHHLTAMRLHRDFTNAKFSANLFV
jgi:hypothetical protein